MVSITPARTAGKMHPDRRYRTDFAAAITRQEFGRYYSAPNSDNFIDTSPAEIMRRRATLWGSR